MFAQQPYYATHAAGSMASCREDIGEPVLVAPRHASAFDDRVCASHAAFGWRAASMIVTQGDGRRLHIESYRPTARFAADRVPPSLGIGDRITRSWDGALFEIVSAHREGAGVCCDLVDLGGRMHQDTTLKWNANALNPMIQN